MTVDLPLVARGKVREVYDAGADRLLLVASDRISAYDWVLPTPIPDKGRVLTALSLFWFDRTREIVPNHLVSASVDDLPDRFSDHAEELAGRSMLVRRARMIPIECVARGYITGSGWKEYRETGAVCGIELPAGLVESERLPEPIFTPATKAETGHDENVDFERAAEIVGDRALLEELRRLSLELYAFAAEHARERGIILADTKFEFGLVHGEIVLCDEIFTPDSSRFWPADSYTPGEAPPSFDKQFVRDYCESLGWDKQPPGPELPDDVVAGTRARYVEAFERLTGIPFADYLSDPEIVLR